MLRAFTSAKLLLLFATQAFTTGSSDATEREGFDTYVKGCGRANNGAGWIFDVANVTLQTLGARVTQDAVASIQLKILSASVFYISRVPSLFFGSPFHLL